MPDRDPPEPVSAVSARRKLGKVCVVVDARYRGFFPSSPRSVRPARRAVVEFAKTCGFGGQDLADIQSAVGEALANAAEHGHDDVGGIEVLALRTSDGIEIEIKDHGAGFTGWHDYVAARPPTDAPRGFGIFIMHAMMDTIEYSERGTRLRLVKRLSRAELGVRDEA